MLEQRLGLFEKGDALGLQPAATSIELGGPAGELLELEQTSLVEVGKPAALAVGRLAARSRRASCASSSSSS